MYSMYNVGIYLSYQWLYCCICCSCGVTVSATVVQQLGECNIKLGSFDLQFFTRYVDDILVAVKDESTALALKQFLESLHPNLGFKIELEYDNSIPFLDILICRTSNSIVTGVYRKPTHSGVLTHYESYVPFRYKRGMINTLLDRGYKIGSTWHTVIGEFNALSDMLARNGYTRNFRENVIGKFLDKKRAGPVAVVESDPEERTVRVEPRKVFCRLPYIEGASQKVQKTIRGFLAKYDPTGTKLKLIFLDNCSYLGDSFNFKDKGPLLMRSGVVYQLSCSCGAQYIGETERNLVDRMEEHAKTEGAGLSAVGEHLKANPDHSVDFQSPKVLGSSPYHYKLLIKEALYIQQHNPILNTQVWSKKLYVFNV